MGGSPNNVLRERLTGKYNPDIDTGNNDNLHQKRHSSSSNNHNNEGTVKRRLPIQTEASPIGNFLDSFGRNTNTQNTPSKTPVSRPHSISRRPTDHGIMNNTNMNINGSNNNNNYNNQGNTNAQPTTPGLIKTNNTGNSLLDNIANTNNNVDIPDSPFFLPARTQSSILEPMQPDVILQPVNTTDQEQSLEPELGLIEEQYNANTDNADMNYHDISSDLESTQMKDGNSATSSDPGKHGKKHIITQQQNFNSSTWNKSTQALIAKLQDIYKTILVQEVELQNYCSAITVSQTTDLKKIWAVYKINVDLVNNYVIFITTALLPSQSQTDLLIGQEIIDVYKIERRLWLYGTITFLDVLKHFSKFMDPEICCQFIIHVFISIANMSDYIPKRFSIPWLSRLGDLSRMATALYPPGSIDWKLSAEYWYSEAMKYTYGVGKLYYHMATVQQNSLAAFINLGKSVFCRDAFVPTQQYLQLVIDNIYQRAYISRGDDSSSNVQILDYLKHNEIMVLPNFMENFELQRLAYVFFSEKFGKDFVGNNFFDARSMFIQNLESLKFYFRHSPLFAQAHILQMVGYGNIGNAFALLYELPKFIKENELSKQRKKSKTNSDNLSMDNLSIPDYQGDCIDVDDYFNKLENIDIAYKVPSNADIWIKSLQYTNTTGIFCGMMVLQKFLQGPLVTALPHLLPWVYFLISVAIKVDSLKDLDSQYFWKLFIRRIFPWNTIVNFLNVLIAYLKDNSKVCAIVNQLCETYSEITLEEILINISEDEDLPEVWSCWGSLWFDTIYNKSDASYDSLKSAGINDVKFLDAPYDGIVLDEEDDNGNKFWKRACRIIFLFKGFAEKFDHGLRLSSCDSLDPSSGSNIFVTENQKKNINFVFKLDSTYDILPIDEQSNKYFEIYSLFAEKLPPFEKISENNLILNAVPQLSVIEGESIFNYMGYKRLLPCYYYYDKNGNVIKGSIYSNWEAYNQMGTDFKPKLENSSSFIIDGLDDAKNFELREKRLFSKYLACDENKKCSGNALRSIQNMGDNAVNEGYDTEDESGSDNIMSSSHITNQRDLDRIFLSTKINGDMRVVYDSTYFIFDATTWLRHFAHIYKLAYSGLLNFVICLTTFQELRFLRRSRDENVMEAATRAVIVIRQLYRLRKVIPLRFNGKIATHIEEHLEFEEQITWRSHVNEFVIEAVVKSQENKTFGTLPQNDSNSVQAPEQSAEQSSKDKVLSVLVTDDRNMDTKAKERNIRTCSTRFIFSICNQLGMKYGICTN
ncbi:hypothetical protein RNJ44_04452 [Nakaseomyces bracarensis]|uniref:PIN domain-containing protein n=1 Tax=Nakaseomyces bracarensis TaxID=273131 RepID=A0ABR4NV38_9SACH